MAAPGGPPQLSYTPKPQEQAYYGALFGVADPQRAGSIGGPEAVRFFSTSKLPVDTLKHVWTVADNPPSNALDFHKFCVAVRLIQLLQNGQKGNGPHLEVPPGVVLRPVHFEGISGAVVPLPPPEQAEPPTSPQRSSQAPTPPRHPQGPGPRPPPPAQGPSMALTAQDPYTLSPGEEARYESLFPEYAKPDGYVYGPEAVSLFNKSGLPQQQLAAIWNMVDTPVDNRLDRLEFAMAMHLIVCVSKKNLPMPPGLPVSLKQLKAQATSSSPMSSPPRAPASPSSLRMSSPVQHQQAPPAQPYQQAPPPVPQQAPPTMTSSLSGLQGPPPLQQQGGMAISDAFAGLEINGTAMARPPSTIGGASYAGGGGGSVRAESPMVPPHHVSLDPHSERSRAYSVPDSPPRAVAAAPTPASPTRSTQQLKANYQMGDADDELTKLKAVLQKLQAENISLKATMGTLSEDEREVQKELHATVAEISTLSSKLTTLRAQVLASKSRLLEATAELKAAKEKKGVIKDLIAEAQATKDAMDDAYQGIEAANEAARAMPPAPAPAFEADLFGFDSPPAPAPMAAPDDDSDEEPMGRPETVSRTSTFSNEPNPDAYRPTAVQGGAYRYNEEKQAVNPNDFYGHHRMASDGSAGYMEGEGIMGGGPTPLPTDTSLSSGIPSYTLSMPSAVDASGDNRAAIRNIEEMKQKLKEAESIARDAEEARRQVAAQTNELRRVADEAEKRARENAVPAEDGKGKKGGKPRSGFLGRGKKKDAKEAERLAVDAKQKKEKLLEAEAQNKDAQALAAETKREAERLRREVEDAELTAASEASMQQVQPKSNGHPPPQTAQQDASPYEMGIPSYNYGVPKPQPTANNGGYGGTAYGGYNNGDFNPSVMGSGGVSIPTPAGGDDPYGNPFQ